MLPFLYQPKESAVTFANPGDGASFLSKLADIGPLLPTEKDTAIDTALAVINRPDAYRDLFGAAAKQTEFVDNAFARDLSREEAYDRRIKTVKDATGIALENPERWGYQQDAKRAVRNDLMASGGQGIDETGGIPAYRRRIFDQKLSELRGAHPDKSANLTFGNIDNEGRAIAKGAEDEYTRARSQPDLDPAASLVTEFAGAMWGMRRDPLMVGSLFFGPTSAAGKAVIARVASAGLFQGLYNAGLSAIEQPAVQAWRDEVGLKSGVVPAVENVGLAFLFGAIPGAAFRGIHEAARAPVKRVLEGRAEPGDAEAAIKAVGGEVSPQEAGAIKLGEEMDAAERVTRPPLPKDITPQPTGNELASIPLSAAEGMRLEQIAKDSSSTSTKTIYDFNLFDGPNKVGTIKLSIPEWDKTFVYIDGITGDGPQSLGPTKTRGILALIKEQFPEAETVGGQRTTGAVGEGGVRYASVDLPDPARLHEDLITAAQRYADDPVNQPSPAAVGFIENEAPTPLWYQGIPAEGVGKPQKSEYWTTNLGAAQDYAGRGGFIHVAKESDLPPGMVDRADRGRSDSLIPGVAGEPAQLRQVPTVATLPRDTPAESFLALGSKSSSREIAERIAEANPQSKHEAQMAASEAIEDIGNRETMARTRVQMEAERFTLEETFDQDIKPAPARSKDPLDKIPMIRDDGTPTLVSARQAARAGERETQFAELIRECK